MKVVFTGGAYYKVQNLQMGESDFTLNYGRRWIKSTKMFSVFEKPFVCLKNAQVLTEVEIEQLRK